MKPAPDDVSLVLASPLFDVAWYRRRHPGAGDGARAAAHFLAGAAAEPGPDFSTRHYLLANPDVAASGMNALVHYLRYGQAEGRPRYAPGAALPAPPPSPRDAAIVAREQAAIAETALFDADHYLDAYPDIRAVGVDPLRHYLEHGAREGRAPNPWFDTAWYRARHMRPDDDGNPLAHYLASPRRDRLDTSARFDGADYVARHADAAASPLAPLDHFLRTGLALGRSGVAPSPGDPAHVPVADLRRIRCTVVVPVHDAADAVAACLDALFRHTRFGGEDRLLVVDDASSQPAVATLLASLAGRPGVRVVRHDRNLGYTRTVDEAIGLADGDDVVLLNSDTRVGPHWLRRLKATAASHPRIGSVTAVSNAAGEFSVPAAGNHPPPAADPDAVARAVAEAGAAAFDVPTGNGFCLYLKRELLVDIGGFDVDAFPEGYGEENDLCLRAAAAGWTHRVDPAVYVDHRRSASFGARREALAEAGYRRVADRYPHYEGAIAGIRHSPGFVDARHRIARQLRRLGGGDGGYRPRPRILFVISTRIGGTPHTNADLMRAIDADFEAFALASDGSALELLRAGPGGYERLQRIALAEPIRFAGHSSLEYDLAVRTLMLRLGIDLLHVRHLAWHGLGLVDAARSLGIPVVMSFHDFYCVCPTVHLLDLDGAFHPRGVPERAPNPLWADDPTVQPMTPVLLHRWQQRMQEAIAGVSAFVTTSPGARTLVLDALPAIAARADDFHVIPHGRDFDRFIPPRPVPATERRMKVLFPGNLAAHKGAGLIAGLKAADVHDRLELHVLGLCPPDLEGLVVAHGPYERGEFAARVAAIEPDVAAVLSVWPETYSHTLTECWASGLPVVGVDIGAVGERIRTHGGGWLLPFPPTVQALHDLLATTVTAPGERARRGEEVLRWQQSGPPTEAAMAARYMNLYRGLLTFAAASTGLRNA